MIWKFIARALVVVGVLTAAATPAWAECKFEKLAELHVTMKGLRPTILTKINDKDAVLLVDTGAFFSMLSPDALAKYGMKSTGSLPGMRIRAAGGGDGSAKVATARVFNFAGGSFRNAEFLLADRAGGGGIDGIIGQNFLGATEIEYDLANGAIRLFRAAGCGDSDNLAYWTAGHDLSRVSIDGPTQMFPTTMPTPSTTARINGQSIRVQFDTGASLSVLSRPSAARAGVRPTSEGVVASNVSYGVFGQAMETWIAPFESFAIGNEEIRHTRLRMADIELPDAQMLLGADFFLSHRVLVSKRQQKLYFTYGGGPVFRLETAPAASASTAVPQALATAAEFSRRGAASAARRDFVAAIADYTRAIELEPEDGRRYYDRALAHVENHQPLLAMADADQALRHNPQDSEALLMRGRLHAEAGAADAAQVDFDAALKFAPENFDMPMRVGAIYDKVGLHEAALRLYDHWIAAHPKSERLGPALNARCWARATWGRQLDLALADCDAAMKQGMRTSTVMDSRALVLLRMQRMDEAIAQYDAALRLQPKAAWSRYARGLAKLARGDTAAGNADIAEAIAIDPGLPEEAKRYGLTPSTPAAKAS